MAKKLSAMMSVFIAVFLMTLGSYLLTFFIPIESFGAQGGEMVQLAAGHVPTIEDIKEDQEEARQVKREIINMTGYW